MQRTVFKAAAYATLFVDAYLALASVATGAMPRQYHYYLPPFGFAGVSATPKLLLLVVVAWTALLAIGCLSAHSKGLQGLDVYVLLVTLLIMITVVLGIVLTVLPL
jgi:hypothetical protein